VISPADLAWWLELAPRLPWRLAKTIPDAPHSYVVKGKTLPSVYFDRAVRVIRTFGQPGRYWHLTRIYLTDPSTEMVWWTQGAPLSDTVIINQAQASVTYGLQDAPRTAPAEPRFTVYDALATDYDARYASPADLAENAAVASLIRERFRFEAPLTLDIGCGTGLLLDLGLTAPGAYTGVDPSQGMLNQLVLKHPKVSRLVPATMEDALPSTQLYWYDLVTSLFGSASYLHPTTVRYLPALIRPGGMLVLMHYRPGYLPDYERDLLDWHDLVPSHQAAAGLVAQHSVIGNFDVTVVHR
jgi:hypothetical protein